jgi:hypothetical protein
MMGERLVIIVTAHDFKWQEGKEGFVPDEFYAAAMNGLLYAAAEYGLAHPRPDVQRELEEEKAAREAAEKYVDVRPVRPPQLRQLERWPDTGAGGAGPSAQRYPTPLDPRAYGKDMATPVAKKPKSAGGSGAGGAAGGGAAGGGSAAHAAGNASNKRAAPAADEALLLAEEKRLKSALSTSRRLLANQNANWNLLRTTFTDNAAVAKYFEAFLEQLRATLKA